MLIDGDSLILIPLFFVLSTLTKDHSFTSWASNASAASPCSFHTTKSTNRRFRWASPRTSFPIETVIHNCNLPVTHSLYIHPLKLQSSDGTTLFSSIWSSLFDLKAQRCVWVHSFKQAKREYHERERAITTTESAYASVSV